MRFFCFAQKIFHRSLSFAPDSLFPPDSLNSLFWFHLHVFVQVNVEKGKKDESDLSRKRLSKRDIIIKMDPNHQIEFIEIFLIELTTNRSRTKGRLEISLDRTCRKQTIYVPAFPSTVPV